MKKESRDLNLNIQTEIPSSSSSGAQFSMGKLPTVSGQAQMTIEKLNQEYNTACLHQNMPLAISIGESLIAKSPASEKAELLINQYNLLENIQPCKGKSAA